MCRQSSQMQKRKRPAAEFRKKLPGPPQLGFHPPAETYTTRTGFSIILLLGWGKCPIRVESSRVLLTLRLLLLVCPIRVESIRVLLTLRGFLLACPIWVESIRVLLISGWFRLVCRSARSLASSYTPTLGSYSLVGSHGGSYLDSHDQHSNNYL